MGIEMNKTAYKRIIKENISWLKLVTANCLEQDHVIEVLNASIKSYGPPNQVDTGDTKLGCRKCDTGQISMMCKFCPHCGKALRD